MVKVKEDLTGKKFGYLTVLERDKDRISPSGRSNDIWKCICDCGNECLVFGHNLRNGVTKSCGCYRKKASHKANKKYNQYNFLHKYGIGYTFKGEEFYFDLEDYDKIKDYCWHINNSGYVASNRNKILMHRLIMNCPEGLYVDHINHNILDNRKNNLRIVTVSQNNFNRKIRTDSSSGVAGIHYRKDTNKWQVRIGINNNRINIGSFNNFEDAIIAKKEAEEKYFGEYSYDNSMEISKEN